MNRLKRRKRRFNVALANMVLAKGTPWYLAGGVASANCLAAFQPRGALSLATSYSNLISPGTNDAAPGTAPTFDAATGWTFTAASSQYLIVGSGAIASAAPITFICLFQSNDVTGAYALQSIHRTSVQNNRFVMNARGNVAGDPVGAILNQGATSDAANTTTGFIANAWYVGAAVFTSATSRAAFIDGGSKGTNATAVTPASVNQTTIGASNISAGATNFFDGKIGACAFYNTNLSDAQVLAISNELLTLVSAPERLANMPVSIEQHGFAELNDLFYIVAGADVVEETNGVYSYNPATNTWSAALAVAPEAVQSPVVRAVNGKIYCIGGLTTTPTYSTVKTYEYDPDLNTWTEKADAPTAREDMGAGVIGSKIYVFGGLTNPTHVVGAAVGITTMEVYDTLTNTWDESKADLPAVKMLGDFGAALNGKLYAIGATDEYAGYPTLNLINTVYEYDPDADTWTAKAVCPEPRAYTAVAALNDELFIVCGATTNITTYTRTIYSYNPATDAWTYRGQTPLLGRGAGLLAYNGNLYMSGGFDGSYRNYLFRLKV